jgi:hypothetical protein
LAELQLVFRFDPPRCPHRQIERNREMIEEGWIFGIEFTITLLAIPNAKRRDHH